jgi:hypothetical protein
VIKLDAKERAKKDIGKLDRMLIAFKGMGLGLKYPQVLEYAENYASDARHFFAKGDHFTAFGAANYAYGFLDAVLVIEGKKDETTTF